MTTISGSVLLPDTMHQSIVSDIDFSAPNLGVSGGAPSGAIGMEEVLSQTMTGTTNHTSFKDISFPIPSGNHTYMFMIKDYIENSVTVNGDRFVMFATAKMLRDLQGIGADSEPYSANPFLHRITENHLNTDSFKLNFPVISFPCEIRQ